MYHHPISFRRQFPIEVQEKIIDQLRHDIWPLRSCALTCQAWHVRSRFHLFQGIHVHNLEQLNEICSYLRVHKSLRPIVQSIVIESESPSISGPSWDKPVLPFSDLVCTPLLNQLPNLRRCKLRQARAGLVHPVAFHRSMLTYLKIHSYIETLYLYGTISSTPTPIIEVLTSLPRLKNLICHDLDVGSWQGSQNFVPVVEYGPAYSRKLTKLRSLVVRNCYFPHVWAILPLAGGTIESLVLDISVVNSRDLSHSWETYRVALSRVSSLEIHVHLPASRYLGGEVDPRIISSIDFFLPAFKPRALQDMQIVFHGSSYRLHRLLQNPASTTVLASLQQTVLDRHLKSVTFTAAGTEQRQRNMFTRDLLKQSFPALFEREMAKAAFPAAHIGHESPVHTIVVSTDGLWVASAAADDSVLLWCTEDGSVVDDWNVPTICGLMFIPESGHLTVCSRDRLYVRDMKPPFKIVAETPVETQTHGFAWSPDGTLCALAGITSYEVFRICVIRTGTLEVVSDYQLDHRTNFWGSTTPVFSHDSRRLLFTQSAAARNTHSAEESEATSWVWDVYSSAPPRKLMNHGALVCDSKFNPVDSAQVFLTLGDGAIQVRDVASGAVLVKLGGGESMDMCLYPLYSPDGTRVAIVSRRKNNRLCNMGTGTVLNTLESPRASWMSFSPDGSRILSTSPDAPAQLWDTRTGQPVLSLVAHINPVEAASFSPDGRYIVLGYEDGTVRLWNAEDGTCLAILTEHAAPVTQFAFSLDGEIMCSAATDGTVCIRHLRAIWQH